MIQLVFLIILTVSVINIHCTTSIGYIYNATYTSTNIAAVITYDRTCSECVCYGFYSSVPSLYVGLNCYTNNKTCALFSNYSSSATMRIDFNSSFIFIQQPPSQNTPTVLLTSTNETVYPIWNTIAGGNSTASTAGIGVGNYVSDEEVYNAFDQNIYTKYTSFGNCIRLAISPTCGNNTGFYLTLGRGASLLVAIQFVTGNDIPDRDPFTITVEGSNETSSALNLGSSWTLIYSGPTGLQNDPGRSNYGITQSMSNNVIWYKSYRLLVTSIRDNSSSTQYGEVQFLGY